MEEILRLQKSNCKNCYKCIRNCPVKAIRFSAGQAHVVENECVLCGHCFEVCPQNAKQISSDVEKIRVMLQTSEVYASVAPSFAAEFPGVGIEALEEALKKLGFKGAEETALGATVVKTEYERILREEKPNVLISSCCPSVNLLMRKHYPDTLFALAPVVTPMHAHCKDMMRRHSGAATVFIGPCIAKKYEAAETGCTDAVLSFKELRDWFDSEGIVPELRADEAEGGHARVFPTAGGILDTMEKLPEYTYLALDGLEKCMAVLEEIRRGTLQRCFIEMSACVGSCSGGPLLERNPNGVMSNTLQVLRYAPKQDFEVEQPSKEENHLDYFPITRIARQPSEYEIEEMLVKMGKTKPEDMLNCGSCGYNGCREKAIAIIQGKAELTMCLPYMMERAESFSDAVVLNSPIGILVLNDDMEIQRINPVACRLLRVRNEKDVLGDHVDRLMDPAVFKKVHDKRRTVTEERVFLAEYSCYVHRTTLYNSENHLYISIMRDVTSEMDQYEKKLEMRMSAVEIADGVAKKQLQIVQDIASLLGETAADTLIAIERLKETISDD